MTLADAQLSSPLGRRSGRTPTDAAELRSLRAQAWHQQAVAVLPLAEIDNDWLLAAVTAWCNERYGRRPG